MRLITEKIILRSPYKDYYTGAIIKNSPKENMYEKKYNYNIDIPSSTRKNIPFVIH